MFPSALKCAGTWLAVIAISACRPAPEDGANAAGNRTIPPIPLPVAEAPLDREDLLLAVIRASSAHAAGTDDIAGQRRLDGKPFELRIRFGCPGGARGNDAFSASVEPEGRSLALQAAPSISKEDPAIVRIGSEAFEAVEGFWLARPWMLEAACPASREPPLTSNERGPPDSADDETPQPAAAATEEAAEAPRPLVGIAQFFTRSDPRTIRRGGRAYATTKVLPPDSAASDVGYNLILSGRLRPLPGGRVVSCATLKAGQAPTCVISAQFDSVRFERPDTGEVLAEWSRS